MKTVDEEKITKLINELADLDLEIYLAQQGDNKKLADKLRRKRKRIVKELDEIDSEGK